MNEGFWINYQKGSIWEVHEHEQWLRVPGNARKLGVPNHVISMFGKFEPVSDRNAFLLFVMRSAPVMRARGHGSFVTFEYSSRDRSGPMDAIWMWGKKNAGPFTQLVVNNFATKEETSMSFGEFEKAADAGGYEAVMRVARVVRFRMRSSVARELMAVARELS